MPGKRGAPYGNRNAAGPHGGRQGPAKIKLPKFAMRYTTRQVGTPVSQRNTYFASQTWRYASLGKQFSGAGSKFRVLGY